MTLIIAECGINHNGIEAEAYKLIDAAVETGADVAKFQLFKPIGTREQYAHLCLSLEAYPRLNAYCKERGIGFACTAFDAESLEWLLKNTEMAFVKISSGENMNKELLQVADKSSLPIIQSLRRDAGTYGTQRERKILHVVSSYPCPVEMYDLKRMKQAGINGLSTHCVDTILPAVAIGMGAEIVEAHIKLNDTDEGPDMSSSFNPAQFKEMVCNIRKVEKAL